MGNMVKSACIRCGTEFEQPEWRSKHKTARKKTCSPKCCYNGRRGTPEKRFWEKVDKRGPSECWLWTGCVGEWDYGQLWLDGKMRLATHFSWKLIHGPVPQGKILMHSCDVPRCVNPAHLSAGTLRENSRDALNKSRRFGMIKLNPEKVREIRKLIGTGKVEWSVYKKVGKKFNVTPSTIHHLHIRRTWAWVA